MPARTGCVDNDPGLTWRVPRTDAVVAGPLTRAKGPELADVSPWIWRAIRTRDGVVMDSPPEVACVRVGHG